MGRHNHTHARPSRKVRIRFGRPDEIAALQRLAELDDSTVPASPVLVADVSGELWAARSLGTRDVIATPFERTSELVELLALRAEQLRVAPRALGGDDPKHPTPGTAAHAH